MNCLVFLNMLNLLLCYIYSYFYTIIVFMNILAFIFIFSSLQTYLIDFFHIYVLVSILVEVSVIPCIIFNSFVV